MRSPILYFKQLTLVIAASKSLACYICIYSLLLVMLFIDVYLYFNFAFFGGTSVSGTMYNGNRILQMEFIISCPIQITSVSVCLNGWLIWYSCTIFSHLHFTFISNLLHLLTTPTRFLLFSSNYIQRYLAPLAVSFISWDSSQVHVLTPRRLFAWTLC